MSDNKKLNGFKNGRDLSDGIGGDPPINDFPTKETKTAEKTHIAIELPNSACMLVRKKQLYASDNPLNLNEIAINHLYKQLTQQQEINAEQTKEIGIAKFHWKYFEKKLHESVKALKKEAIENRELKKQNEGLLKDCETSVNLRLKSQEEKAKMFLEIEALKKQNAESIEEMYKALQILKMHVSSDTYESIKHILSRYEPPKN